MALYEEFAPQPNRLINAQSAYLRAAAYQPVGWYEYGAEAFAEARRQDKPIFLDIGASWCHWCHVIDRESYDDPEIATYLNELFIPVKVDRDERPDIDARYQTAVQLLIGRGGWPLTVFLTPDGEPFYGGTYFPPEDRGSQHGMKTLLPRLSDAYRYRRPELDETARVLTKRIGDASIGAAERREVTDELFQRIARDIALRFDAEHGGFEQGGPKFPQPGAIELALLQSFLTGDAHWRTMVEKTLTAMGRGGIYDQLGGGFHRYATDARWATPHFEKMGSENALLLENYVHAYRATGETFFREIAEGTLDYLLTVLADGQQGGFYSTQDADTGPRDDGDYWTWSYDEFVEVLTPEEVPLLTRYFGVRRRGDMPESGRNVLRRAEPAEEIARTLHMPLEDVRQRLASGLRKLRGVRKRRTAPRVDTTPYANWNALLIFACLEAGALLKREDATAFALRSAATLLRDAYEPDHGIYHAFHGTEGARLPGMLEDQVYGARAFVQAFMVSGERQYLDTACHLLDLCIAHYWDEEGSGFFDTARNREAPAVSEVLRQPRKVIDDMPTPSANALAALTLDRVWALTHDDRYHDYARRTLETFAVHAPEFGPAAASYALAIYFHLHPPTTVAIVGAPDSASGRDLWQTALETYRPGRLVAVYPAQSEKIPYPAPPDGQTRAYVCAGHTCADPISDAEELREVLRHFGC